MTAPTHIAFAELLYLLILTTTGVALNVPNALLIAVSSTLPDIDTGASRIGKLFPFLSLKLERRFGHRTLTHSLSSVLILSIVLSPLSLIGMDLYTCFVIGYLSHPLLDTGTVNGTKLFYPFSNLRCVFPLDVNNTHRYRVQTGSATEKVLGVIFFVGCIPTFYVASQGYERFIRVTQQSIEAAVRDYEQFSRNHFVMANIDSHDMLTKQPLAGTFEVVGALNPHTLVFKSPDGRLHTVGKSFEADYVAESIVCQRDRQCFASMRIVDMSNQLLAQLAALVDTSIENYFFGDIATMDKVSLPENIRLFSPVTGSGGDIKLNFATLNDIREYNLEYVFVTKGMLTIKSISPIPPPGNLTSSGLALPKFDNFAQLSYLIEPRDSVTLLRQKGDTIRHGDLLASKMTPAFFEEQLALNEENIGTQNYQQAASLEDYERRIVAAELTVALDSADYHHALTLAKNGFISPTQIVPSELKWHNEERALRKLQSAKTLLARQSSLDIARLHLLGSQLHAKARAARLQAEIRSPISGVLLEVRQMPQDNKTRLVFIIRRLP